MASDASISEMEGQIVSRTFSAGLVVLSYVVSWIGAWTTLELINKRTAGRGAYNWFLLVGSSISMGGIAIWGMHFLGNRAILLGSGEDILQIAYNPAFSALSFFVPIVVLLAAFITIGSNEKISWLRVTLGGALAGLSICGMHYLGQAGISNYTAEYNVGNVVGSIVIAVVATVAALFTFFILRASWTAQWWKRALTALLLAGAVSGMHWVAEVGTAYRLKQVDGSISEDMSRNSTVIVVIVLSVSACFILITLSLLAQRRRSQSANRAQQVVLAAAIFDKDGKLLVTPEGLLPSQKITNSYIERSFEDVFGISHPVFLWIFRTSRNWSAIEALLPSMRSHINQVSTFGGCRSGASENVLSHDSAAAAEDYSIIFQELFCVAAAELADQLDQPLENAGVLFDEILSTGQSSRFKARVRKSAPASSVDIERGGLDPQLYGRGQLLFLTRSVDRREAETFLNAGFRFAAIHNVVDILAQSMQINSDDLSMQLSNMRHYSAEQILEPGVHMAYFAIRANVRGGFDILVQKDARNQLPTMMLPLMNLDSWHIEYLSKHDGMSVSACLKLFKTMDTTANLSEKEQLFVSQFHDTLEALRDEINDPAFLDAILIAKPVSAPCRGSSDDAPPGKTPLIAFRSIVPIHSRSPGEKLEFVPLSFFKMQQHIYKNSPDHNVFARRIHRELAPITSQSATSMVDKEGALLSPNSFVLNGSNKSLVEIREELEHRLPTLVARAPEPRKSMRFWKRNLDVVDPANSRSGSSRDDASSEMNLFDNPFGGILVSQEVSVEVREATGDDREALKAGAGPGMGLEMMDLKTTIGSDADPLRMGTLGVASTEVEDSETYVDSLLAICVETRQ